MKATDSKFQTEYKEFLDKGEYQNAYDYAISKEMRQEAYKAKGYIQRDKRYLQVVSNCKMNNITSPEFEEFCKAYDILSDWQELDAIDWKNLGKITDERIYSRGRDYVASKEYGKAATEFLSLSLISDKDATKEAGYCYQATLIADDNKLLNKIDNILYKMFRDDFNKQQTKNTDNIMER